MPRIAKTITFRFCALVVVLSIALGLYREVTAKHPWQERLYTPTYILRAHNTFILIDCWHHRALWSDQISNLISSWKTLDDDLAGPHSVASNGDIFVIDDTERGGVRVYRQVDGGMKLIQKVEGLGGRTHRVHYSERQKSFYVLSSGLNTLTKLTPNEAGLLNVTLSKKLDFLGLSYTRSFSIYEDYAYFVSGPGRITKTLLKDDSFSVVQQFDVSPDLRSMNDVFYSGSYWYLTATPKRIVRVKDLSDLTNSPGDAEDIYSELGLRGTPYYITIIDGRIFIPEITEHSGLLSFVEHGDKLLDVRVHFDFGPPSPESVERKMKHIK